MVTWGRKQLRPEGLERVLRSAPEWCPDGDRDRKLSKAGDCLFIWPSLSHLSGPNSHSWTRSILPQPILPGQPLKEQPQLSTRVTSRDALSPCNFCPRQSVLTLWSEWSALKKGINDTFTDPHETLKWDLISHRIKSTGGPEKLFPPPSS